MCSPCTSACWVPTYIGTTGSRRSSATAPYLRQPDTAVTAELTAAYNRKLWTVPLDEIEPRALHHLELGEKGAGDPLAPQARARFGYPLRGGFQALMDGFLPLLPGQLRTGTSVAAVDAPARRVTLASGESIGYQNLVVTEPLPHLVQMLGDRAPSGVREAANSLRSLSMRCVNIGVRRAGIAGEHWLYYPADTVFHRIFMQSNASPSSTPAGCSSFTCEITYSPAKTAPMCRR